MVWVTTRPSRAMDHRAASRCGSGHRIFESLRPPHRSHHGDSPIAGAFKQSSTRRRNGSLPFLESLYLAWNFDRLCVETAFQSFHLVFLCGSVALDATVCPFPAQSRVTKRPLHDDDVMPATHRPGRTNLLSRIDLRSNSWGFARAGLPAPVTSTHHATAGPGAALRAPPPPRARALYQLHNSHRGRIGNAFDMLRSRRLVVMSSEVGQSYEWWLASEWLSGIPVRSH